MTIISGAERKALREGLKQAFQTYEALRRMARDHVDFDLNMRTHAGVGVAQAADELMDEMLENKGRAGIVRLIESARAERPDNPALRAAEQRILGTSDPMGDVYPPAALVDELKTRESLERVIVDAAGFPSFADVLRRLGAAEYRVCVIDYRLQDGKRVCGTGFLVSNDIVMTNHHVIDYADKDGLPGTSFDLTFGYRSKEAQVARYRLVERDWLLASDSRLDYALLKVDGAPGSDPLVDKGTTERGFFKLVNETPAENEPLLILQHPFNALEANPATLRLTVGFAKRPGPDQPQYILRHSANTDEGSSGSPVFSGRMDLIGLHNWGGQDHNEAIKVGFIRDHLESTGHGGLLG